MLNVRIREHYEVFWADKANVISNANINGHQVEIYEFAPNEKRSFWTYATSGMAHFKEAAIELHIFSLEQDEFMAILLNAIADFHFSLPGGLGLGHTVNFGQAWKPGSNCEYGLISLPYLDGPELEILEKTRLLWLIPITRSERDFKKENGLEALELLFETNNFHYLDPLRASIVGS